MLIDVDCIPPHEKRAVGRPYVEVDGCVCGVAAAAGHGRFSWGLPVHIDLEPMSLKPKLLIAVIKCHEQLGVLQDVVAPNLNDHG